MFGGKYQKFGFRPMKLETQRKYTTRKGELTTARRTLYF